MLVTICGCGNAGIAQAADVAALGFKVNLFEVPEFEGNLTKIKELNGINLSGKSFSGKNGFVKLNKVTSNAKDAVEGADLIMITAPAQNHENIFEHILPYLSSGQIILASTGYWASLRLNKLLESKKMNDKVILAELSIFPYLSKKEGPADACIYNYKRLMKLAAFPASQNNKAYEIVKQVYPQVVLSKNVLDNNIYPGNQCLHPQIALPNMVFFFERSKEFRFYNELSDAVSKFADAFDAERLQVAKFYDCDTTTYVEAFKQIYEYSGNNLYELFADTEHSLRWGRVEGIYRVLIEDLCYELIPFEQLAKVAGIEVPVTRAMTDCFSVITGYDYRANGVNLKDLELGGLNREQILQYVNEGI